MISVHLEFATVDEAVNFFAYHVRIGAEPVSKPAPAVTLKTEAKAPPPPAPAPAPATKAQVSYDTDVGPKIAKLVTRNKPAAVEILAKYGVKRGPELKADQLAGVLADVEAALAAADLA